MSSESTERIEEQETVLKQSPLAQRAVELAETHDVSEETSGVTSPIDRLEDELDILHQAYDYYVEQSEEQGIVSAAAEWLLDNLHVVDQAKRLILEDMPSGYYRRLPKLTGTDLRGYPRVYAVSREIVRLCDGQVDIERLTRFVEAYQERRSLTLGELWALPLMLRVAEIELLAHTMAQVLTDKLDLRIEPINAVELPEWPGDDTVVARTVHALRTLGNQKWDDFFEQVSLVERILQSDPAAKYGEMDFETRDRYRRAIEEMGQSAHASEIEIAQEAISLAQEAQAQDKADERQSHVGYYLMGDVNIALEERIGYKPPLGARLKRWIYRHNTFVYLGSITLITLSILAGLLLYSLANQPDITQIIALVLFGLVPATIAAVSVVNILVIRIVPPRVLPKLDLRQGIAPDMRTMVVIPCLLTSQDEIDSLIQQLERHFLGNTDPELGFALLSDYRDAPEKHMAGDEALINHAIDGIRSLNRRYGSADRGPFYLFNRERLWNPSERIWMGWERKRGKLEEFNHYLLGEKPDAFIVREGFLDFLDSVTYVITLDADTVMPRESARWLIGTLAHPLNRAEFEDETDRVIGGYTILQPRTELQPSSTQASLFARIFGGDMGLDLYSRAVSDVYQDLFGEAIFVGKGIYDVYAFHRSLEGRVPENALLSHDLFEGVHGRAGLVTDVVLYEDYPPSYMAYTQRLHRWVRGDWQLFPWLFSRVPSATGEKIPTSLSILDRWKLLDNLRRSIQQLSLLIFFAAGWLVFHGSPVVWTLVGLAVSALPLVAGFITNLAASLSDPDAPTVSSQLRHETGRWLLSLVFLPYEGLILLDAALSTLVRVYITRRKLLQWTTAAHAARLFGRERQFMLIWRRMSSSWMLAALVGLVVTLWNPRAVPVAAPFVLIWLLSPQVASWISQPAKQKTQPLDEEQMRQLRRLARRHWRFFEQFIGPEDHWLPPDHFQEDPRGQIAHRTSPTNIGLMMLSTLTAYKMGYIGPIELMARLMPTFETLESLERYRGHWLNWYDTHTLHPLEPKYVSSVDSGNLAGSLIGLKHGLLGLRDQEIFRWETWQGLGDVLGVMVELVAALEEPALEEIVETLQGHVENVYVEVYEVREAPELWPGMLSRLRNEYWPQLDKFILQVLQADTRGMDAEHLDALYLWFDRVHGQLFNLHDELENLMPWIWDLRDPPEALTASLTPHKVADAWQSLREALPSRAVLSDIPELCRVGQRRIQQLEDALQQQLGDRDGGEPARNWLLRISRRLSEAEQVANRLLDQIEELAELCEIYAQDMDFRFLFDVQREVFYIGYNVSAARLDDNHYDLLASEARLASLIAIAKGEVSPSHWLHLDRPFARANGAGRALLSWNGSMFEYLMPNLLARAYPGTLLDESNQVAVQRQIEYGQSKQVPWGISESAYYHFDSQMNYQYRGFGVPGLGRKRGLGEDLVIAPYATLLSLPVMPQSVLKNVNALQEIGMLGRYGFYESIDYTPGHLPIGQKSAIVRSYYVHHQSMSLIMLGNYLEDDYHINNFHRDPRIQSAELLLQERIPDRAPVEEMVGEPTVGALTIESRPSADPWRVQPHGPVPQVHYISNGKYGVLINNSGGGYSKLEDRALTRWRPDTSRDRWGTWIYIKDLDSNEVWSNTYQPLAGRSQGLEALFSPHQAEFIRHDHDIRVHTEITVPPRQNAEIRRITLANTGETPRRLLLSSYSEAVMADELTDQRHPAFNKLFIQSRYVSEVNGQLFWRRLRSVKEEPLYMLHYLLVQADLEPSRLHEANREVFVGRGLTTRRPTIMQQGPEGFTCNTGANLDPIMAMAQVVELPPHSSVRLAWITTAGQSERAVMSIARQLNDFPSLERSFEAAREQSQSELARLRMTSQEIAHTQGLLSLLLYPHRALRADPETLSRNRVGQPRLWPYAISGDHPIILVEVSEEEHLATVRRMLQAHEYWRRRGLLIDLVILNHRDTNYAQEVQGLVLRLIASRHSRAWLNRQGGIFLLRADQMEDADRTLLYSAARVILREGQEPLEDTLRRITDWPTRLPLFVPETSQPAEIPEPEPVERPKGLLYDNGYGGLTEDGEYVIYLEPREWTPAPWSNVISNPRLGFLVTESGGGFTWFENSGENRLTDWRNDPVADAPSEALYLRDEQTGYVWTATPLPSRTYDVPYLIRHGAGYSQFEHNSHGFRHRLRLYAAPDAPAKIIRLRLENLSPDPRRITATYYAEWVLGTTRSITQQYIIPDYDADTHTLLARNPYNEEFGEAVAFLTADREPHALTTDRAEFIGRNGNYGHPAGLGRAGLENTVRAGDDPCAAMQLHLDIESGETMELIFVLGQGANREEALDVAPRFQSIEACDEAWRQMHDLWDGVLNRVQIKTPEPTMDLLVNRWLLYQSLSSRIWGRSGYYQSSGAYGFRDQLQDVTALVHSRPDLAREQILRAARHQFEKGDVLHWWHPPSGRGVRTRITDDLLWLPFVTAHYIEITDDASILDEEEPFLIAEELEEDKEERYGRYETTEQTFSLFEHCRRAIERGTTSGPHDLPLMGGGDWNDGMNRVGIRGRGESVWLAWFLYANLHRFADLADQRGEGEMATRYRERAAELLEAIQEGGWDGEWYRRAYYDDGTPLGSAESEECQIDSLAQSWAVLARTFSPGQPSKIDDRAREAMESVYERLVRRDERLILLFTPPFDETPHDPGYIKGYLPGIRENGGQYTHAALWAIWAFAELGQGDRAEALFRLINPILHAQDAESAEKYAVEPYVIAADVYGVEPHMGRGGWTWYTGSAAWTYRLALEGLLGLHRRGDRLWFEPHVPDAWDGFDVSYRYGGAVYRIHVDLTSDDPSVILDGEPLESAEIPLEDDGGEHKVTVRIAR